jgi:hypothetical protein
MSLQTYGRRMEVIMYTVKNFKTKKALKEAVAAWNAYQQNDLIEQLTGLKPQPVRYYQPGPFGGNEPVNGDVFCEGPHYPAPHSWYAACTAKDGVIVKVK